MNIWFQFALFSFAFFATLLSPIFFPFLKLNYFVPYLIVTIQRKSRLEALWQAFLCGFTLDLLAANTPFGFWVLNYVVTLLLLFKIKQLFFQDKFLTLPLLTCFFSIISTLLFMTLTHLFYSKVQLRFQWILSDLICYPLFDGIYALLIYNLPLFYLSKYFPQKRREVQSFKMVKD